MKLDDTWCESESVLLAGPLAAHLHLCALSWCNRNLTDGRLPRGVLRRLADLDDPEIEAKRLVDARMWRETETGWEIVDYLDTQPSREHVLHVRKERAEAGRRGGQQSG